MAIAWGFLRWIKVSFFPFCFFGFWFLFFLYLLYLLSDCEMGSWILLFLTIDWGVFCCFCFVGLNVVRDRPVFLMKMVAQGSMPQILWERNHGSESKLILFLIFFNECKDFHLHKAQGGPSKSLSQSLWAWIGFTEMPVRLRLRVIADPRRSLCWILLQEDSLWPYVPIWISIPRCYY